MEYVTTEEAARRLGLTRDGVRQMAKAGRIEHIRVEGRANGATYAIPRPSRRVGTHEAGAAQGRGVAERRRMMGIGYVRKMQGDALLVYNAHEYDRRGVDAEHALIEFVPELGETGVYRVIPFRGERRMLRDTWTSTACLACPRLPAIRATAASQTC